MRRSVQAPEELRFLESRPLGGAFVLDALWQRLGVGQALSGVAARRRVTLAVERLIFCLVANRALAPMSKLAALEWAQRDVWMPGIAEPGEDPQVFYRAMDFLLDAGEEVQREVFFQVADLLNLEVDLILFDTTSTYFEIEPECEDGFREFGHSKDHRPDRPQVVVGMACTKEGIPVRCFTFAGSASDQEIIREVKDALRDWRLHRVIWVLDTGFASEQNRAYLQRAGGHYILGEKLRQGSANRQALARPGRYRRVADGLEVKQVWVGEGERRRRFVVCRNQDEARRDKLRRERALARLEEELRAVERKRGEARTRAEAELLTHPSFKRYLTGRGGRLRIDRQRARAEERLDGKFLLSSSDDSLAAAEIALYYKQLGEVERGWRDQKHVLDLRPVYHRKQERIRAHVLLSFLALLLTRVAETRATDTWPNLRRELERMHLGYFQGSAGRVQQRTETTPRQREILSALDVPEPRASSRSSRPRPRRHYTLTRPFPPTRSGSGLMPIACLRAVELRHDHHSEVREQPACGPSRSLAVLALIATTGTANATTKITPDAGWQSFITGGGIGGASTAGPWTFTTTAVAKVTVIGGFCHGDQFRVLDTRRTRRG